jgi:hypothetical protein
MALCCHRRRHCREGRSSIAIINGGGGDVGDNRDGDWTFDGAGGGGTGGGIVEVWARQMSAGEHWAPVVEEPPHRASTPRRPSTKQMGRDPDTGPKMLNIRGECDGGTEVEYHGEQRFVRGFTMVWGRENVSHSISKLLEDIMLS